MATKPNWFENLENLNWTRLWWVVGIGTAFWTGMAAITVMFPVLDPYYKVISIFIGAVSSAMLFAARGTKYVTNRTEPPADGKP